MMMTTPYTRSTWIKPFTRTQDAYCPKCKSDDLHWEWHATVVFGYHCENAFRDAMASPTGPIGDAILNTDTEHLCRGCLACGHVWCEETADA